MYKIIRQFTIIKIKIYVIKKKIKTSTRCKFKNTRLRCNPRLIRITSHYLSIKSRNYKLVLNYQLRITKFRYFP